MEGGRSLRRGRFCDGETSEVLAAIERRVLNPPWLRNPAAVIIQPVPARQAPVVHVTAHAVRVWAPMSLSELNRRLRHAGLWTDGFLSKRVRKGRSYAELPSPPETTADQLLELAMDVHRAIGLPGATDEWTWKTLAQN